MADGDGPEDQGGGGAAEEASATPPAELRRPLALCADDFALSDGVSEAILRLADAGRLTAVSCMTYGPLWPAHAHRLDGIADRCDIGLHLTLTDQPIGIGLPGLAPEGRLPPRDRLLAAAYAGRLDREAVHREVGRQWEAFVAARRREPDFVDGHQHVHLLPGVRESVLERVQGCPAGRPWVRSCWDAPTQVLRRGVAVGKALAIAVMSRPLLRRARQLGLAHNDSFRGVHGFDPGADVAALFRRFLRGPGRRPLLMSHPGFTDDRLRAIDRVADQRQQEYAYLVSDAFAADLAAAGIRLARLSRMR